MRLGSRAALGAVASLAASLLIAVGPVAAQAPATTPAGPPPWVNSGTRVTHAFSVASVGNGGYELVEDPDGPLTEPSTGTRYREVFTAGSGGAGGSGEGLTEATVVAVEGDDVVLLRTDYANDPLRGGFASISSSSERLPGATVGGLWMHPEALATYQPGAGSAVRVLRGPTTVAGVTYDSVALVDPTPGNYASFTYDAATGVLLTAALRISGGPGSSTQLSTTELRGVRQLAVPGIGSAAPDWVARRVPLSYAGTLEFVNPMDPSSPAQTNALNTTTSFVDTGATWARFETAVTIDLGGVPSTSTGTGAVGGTGPYWWDPAALATFAAGQVLDTDPYTGQTVTVSETGQGPVGPAVGIVGRIPGIDTEVYYDISTGVMIAQGLANASSGNTTRVQLLQMP